MARRSKKRARVAPVATDGAAAPAEEQAASDAEAVTAEGDQVTRPDVVDEDGDDEGDETDDEAEGDEQAAPEEPEQPTEETPEHHVMGRAIRGMTGSKFTKLHTNLHTDLHNA